MASAFTLIKKEKTMDKPSSKDKSIYFSFPSLLNVHISILLHDDTASFRFDVNRDFIGFQQGNDIIFLDGLADLRRPFHNGALAEANGIKRMERR